MQTIDMLNKLGLLVVPDFIESERRQALLSEAALASGEQTTVVPKDGSAILATQVCESQRRTQQLNLSSRALRLLEQRLAGLQKRLASHFDVNLNGFQPPRVYRYDQGGFFAAHQDGTQDGNDSELPDYVRERQVSVIIFLNSGVSEEENPPLVASSEPAYAGGQLVFYGLIDQPQWRDYGFPLIGTPGTLVAFPARVWHEVKPVVAGSRYTVVSWYY